MTVPSGTIQTIPQHGVRGTQRDEPWLSLEDDLQRTRRLIARLAHEVYSSCFVGNPAPMVADRFNRMKSPRIGDLVVETMAQYRADRDDDPSIDYICKGVGYLIKRSREFVKYDDEDLGPDDNQGYDDNFWYIQYGPAPEDVCRWANCEFIAIDIGRGGWDG